LLDVTAREEISGVQASISVKPSYGLTDDEIARMLADSFGTATQDMAERRLREARVEAERMLLATRAALADDGDLLEPDERGTVEALLTALQASRESADSAVIDTAVEALAKGTEAFAAQRMNRSIRRALAGRRVDQL
jgi:molecular chaperone HscA